jgi:hypothetical protein
MKHKSAHRSKCGADTDALIPSPKGTGDPSPVEKKETHGLLRDSHAAVNYADGL